MAKPLWEGLQVFVSVLEEFDAERTDRGREKIKRSVGKRESIVKSKVALPAQQRATAIQLSHTADYITYSSPLHPSCLSSSLRGRGPPPPSF